MFAPIPKRIFKERYRKFAENLQRNEFDELLPDAARHIARLNSSPDNPVKTVILVQKVSFIVPRSDGAYVPEPVQVDKGRLDVGVGPFSVSLICSTLGYDPCSHTFCLVMAYNLKT